MFSYKAIIKFSTFLFIVIFSVTSTASASSERFLDVKIDSPHYEGVEWIAQHGITGYGDGNFGTHTSLSREHAAIFFSRVMSLDDSGRVTDYFDDVKPSYIYANYIAAVGQAKIFTGSDGKFGVNDYLTREQMATVLVNAFELKSTKKVKINLKNVSKAHRVNVQTLADLGITDQTKNFFPSNIVTRGQFATFLKRANDTVSKKDRSTFSQKEMKRIDDINDKWRRLQPIYDGPITNVEPVVTPPYRLGSLNSGALQDALHVTNFVRYIAYLPTNITLHKNFNKKAQAAAVVNAANQKMTHEPARPRKMKDSIYLPGQDGAERSNIGYGYHTITTSIKDGYMPDDDDVNREEVGHRRWILSPRLERVGFGFAVATSGVPHTAMYVNDSNMRKNNERSYHDISWPAKTVFPIEFFGKNHPWSISLNPKIYDASKTKDISVTLTRVNDGKTWKLNRIGSSKDGFLNINTENYGYTPFTIIFQPKQTASYQASDHYKINVDGLYTKQGNKVTFEFETTFFELD